MLLRALSLVKEFQANNAKKGANEHERTICCVFAERISLLIEPFVRTLMRKVFIFVLSRKWLVRENPT